MWDEDFDFYLSNSDRLTPQAVVFIALKTNYNSIEEIQIKQAKKKDLLQKSLKYY